MDKSEIKEILIEQIKEKNQAVTKEQIARMNLYELNIDSLSIMRIISHWMKQGYKVNFAQFMKQPYVENWADIIINAEKRGSATKKVKTESDREPFDLTDVQYAYWIGRRESQYLGGVGCHGYMEVNCKDIDVARLQKSWEVVQKSHAMLRAKYTDDGKQCVMENPYSLHVNVEDITDLSEEDKSKRLMEKREKLSHRLLKIDEGQVAALQLTQLNDSDYVMHFDIDLLICDVLSFKIILRDLARYYSKGIKPQVDDWNFAQYLKDASNNNRQLRMEDEAFWSKKLLEMPDGPKLPLRHGIETVKYPRFKRRSVHFSEQEWESLKNECSNYKLTSAMILLTAYARTIARWSENKKFLLNLPLFNRDNSAGIEDVVADFTNIVLVEMDFSQQRSFLEDAKIIQQAFLENAAHTNVSGIWVMRQLQKQNGRNVKAPVVFSCNLGEPLLSEEFVEQFGNLSYMISQTPQVWIDFQAFDEDNGLTLLWDSIDEIFPQGMLDEMFDCFRQEFSCVIAKGAESDVQVVSIGEARRKSLLEDSQSFKAVPETLHKKIFETAKVAPDEIAIKNEDTDVTIRYGQLCETALSIAAGLQDSKCSDLVAIFMPRGEKQIIAALGVLSSGMAYVPIHVEQAGERVLQMLSEKRISCVITEDAYKDILKDADAIILSYEDLINCEALAEPVVPNGDASAYVIFTSGTTGKPKGVEISHEGAVNTIDAVNEICNVTKNDSILNVSSYDFDLSVYDFWGVLREGGKLFVVTQNSWRDAGRWLEIIEREKITLWNSVPTLVKMLLVEAESRESKISSLRWVMLSGDWIDLDIPQRVSKQSADACILAMGGATEASIWSNYLKVQNSIPDEWISIPYGKPLPKQIYRVVDEKGQDCPCYTSGELWIGGVGVAKGYLGDEVLTAEKFVEDQYGRWYRTGDMGRFWDEDTIEFLGRKDRQVKLRGHRIELGEIENAIDKTDMVNKSYVDVIKDNQAQALIAYVTLNNGERSSYVNNQKSILDGVGIDKIDYSNILNESGANTIKEQHSKYDCYCSNKISTLSAKIDSASIQPQYKCLIAAWQDIQNRANGSSDSFTALDKFFAPFDRNFKGLLEGDVTAKDIVVSEDFIEIDEVLKDDAQSKILEQILVEKINSFSAKVDGEIDILIVDSLSKEFIEKVKNTFKNANCTVAVSSEYYADKFRSVLDDSILVEKLDIQNPLLQLQKGYDLILCNQSLHRMENVNIAMENLQFLLKEKGRLYFIESNKMTSLALMTTVFLKKDYTDVRKESIRMLLSHNEWKEAIDSTDLTIVEELQDDEKFGGFSYFELINNNSHIEVTDSSWISENIKNMVPEYMVPKYYVFLNRIPITSNGKVDRKALKALNPFVQINGYAVEDEVFTDTEKSLKDIWDGLLKADAKVSDNYFVLGGDSLLATVLRNEIKKIFDIDFSLEDIFLKPTLGDMASKIESIKAENREVQKDLVVVRDENPYEPFPLTQIQQSYLIGRSGAFDLGNCSSHCYFEMDTEWLDVDKLQASLNEIIQIHPMMRVVVCKDNLNQKILEKVSEFIIMNENLSEAAEDDVNARLLEVRNLLSHQMFDPYTWPAYDFRYAKLPNNKGRIFISFDNLFFDGWSMFYIFRQWKQLYENPGIELEKADLTFKEYVLSANANLNHDSYEEDLKYWKDKVSSIYQAPELPVNKDNTAGEFTRYSTSLSVDKWDKLKGQIKQMGLTEPVFLMSLYAEVIARYSRHQKFSLNLNP